MSLSRSLVARTPNVPWPEELTAPVRQILRPEMYVPGSLVENLSCLASAQEPLTPQAMLSLVIKYFHAYIHNGSHREAVSLSEITKLFQMFSQFRTGRFEDIPPELVMKFSAWHVALRRLGDLPKTAALFRDIVDYRYDSGVLGNSFVGFDLGAGTGLFLAAQWLQARRQGIKRPTLWGLEPDPQVGRRTQALMADMELAEVLVVDPENPQVYAPFQGTSVNFVSNETIPVVFKLQGSDQFLEIHRALFTALEKELQGARFFPEVVAVDNMRHGVSLYLHSGNSFQVPEPYNGTPLFPRALGYEGRLEILEQVGRPYVAYIPPRCLHLLPRRW